MSIAPSTQVCWLIADNTLGYGRCVLIINGLNLRGNGSEERSPAINSKTGTGNNQQSTAKQVKRGPREKQVMEPWGDLGLERGSPGAPKQHRARLSLKLSPVNL